MKERVLKKRTKITNLQCKLHPFCSFFVSLLFNHDNNLYIGNYALDPAGPVMSSPVSVVPAVPVAPLQTANNIHFGNS